MPSPSSKADFERMWASMKAYIRAGGNDAAGETMARRLSDLVLNRAADGIKPVPPARAIHMGVDLGAGDDSSAVVVVQSDGAGGFTLLHMLTTDAEIEAFFQGEQWTSEERARAHLPGELGSINGFTITETKKR